MRRFGNDADRRDSPRQAVVQDRLAVPVGEGCGGDKTDPWVRKVQEGTAYE